MEKQMKFLFAMCLLASSATVFAQSGRDIYDVMYLPKAETTYGFSTATYQMTKVEESVDSDTDGIRLVQTLGYSFTDSFSAEGSMNYASLETDPDGGSKTTQDGFSDLTLSGRFRLLDGATRFDIVGGALISTADHEIKTNGDSNNVNGGNNYFLGAQFGQKNASYQWSVLAQYTYHDQTYTDSPGFPNSRDDGYNSGLIRGDLLNRLMEKSFIRSHALVNISERNYEAAFSTSASTQTYEIGAEFQHLCTENLLARVGVDYQMKETDASRFDSYHSLRFTIGANYQF